MPAIRKPPAADPDPRWASSSCDASTQGRARRGAGDAVALPSALPGFALDEALARLNGNRRLHAELLLQFVAEHCDCTVSVARSLGATHPAEAVATLHRMRGAAKIVGARDVADAAAAAEEAILHGRPAALDALHDALVAAVTVVCANVSVIDGAR